MTKGTAVKLQIGAALAAVTLVSFAILQVSSAAFSDTTTPGDETWSAAEVQLSDDNWGEATFASSDMVPADTDQACIDVTYDGTVASNVKLHGSTTTSTTDLGEYLNVTIEEVTVTDDDCAGAAVDGELFNGDLAVNTGSFAVAHPDWTDGLDSTFAPDGAGQVQTYRFTVTLADDNNAQGLDTTATFTWEAQNL